ncbi:hypothetical protein JXM67_03785 [candidate division WOR-3 bacterium]|nr:hypothetical protein [candidate division WOR-3 bacterium]
MEDKNREDEHPWHWDPHERHPHHYRSWRDPVGGIVGGLIVVWIGVFFLLRYTDVIPDENWWAYLLLGFGGIFLLGGVVRLFIARFRYRGLGMLVPGIVLSAVGMVFITDKVAWWPLILVVVGVVIVAGVLVRYFTKRRIEEGE